jgi:hypothetical protein
VANTFLKPSAITREAARILHNELAFVKNIDKQHDKETTFGGQKHGGTIRVRLPNQYAVRSGWTIDVQDQTEQSVSLTVGTVRGVDMHFSDADLALEIDEFSKRFIAPAVKRLAAEVDLVTFQSMYKSVYNHVGTAGTTPASALVYLQAAQKMSEFATPLQDRVVIVDPAAQAATVDGLKALFHAGPALAKQYTSGQMGQALGFDWFMSQNVPKHTCGTRDNTTPLVKGASQTGASLIIDGDSNGNTIKAGDIFTIANVYAVNPETKQNTGSLQQFVVTADAVFGASDVTIAISPSIVTSGALQTVNAGPADDAAITWVGAAAAVLPQNLAFHPEAFTFATASLEMPADVSFKGQEAVDGINIRILRQYDINNANYPCRLDVFFGSVAQRASMACRITG